jgi:hypothetical protein
MCDFTEQTPYIAELRAAQSANPSPAPAPDLPPVASPERAGAGDPLVEQPA